jgi:hypothetical protein
VIENYSALRWPHAFFRVFTLTPNSKVIASIEDPVVIKQILAHLELRGAPATQAFRPFGRAPPHGITEPEGTRLTVLRQFSCRDAKLG